MLIKKYSVAKAFDINFTLFLQYDIIYIADEINLEDLGSEDPTMMRSVYTIDKEYIANIRSVDFYELLDENIIMEIKL